MHVDHDADPVTPKYLNERTHPRQIGCVVAASRRLDRLPDDGQPDGVHAPCLHTGNIGLRGQIEGWRGLLARMARLRKREGEEGRSLRAPARVHTAQHHLSAERIAEVAPIDGQLGRRELGPHQLARLQWQECSRTLRGAFGGAIAAPGTVSRRNVCARVGL